MIKNDKPFCKKTWEECDFDGKKIAKQWLKQYGFSSIEENLEEAKGNFKELWDVKGIHPEFGEFRIEAEIKKDWGTKWFDMPFKYEAIHIPFRRRDKAEVHSTHHMVIGGDLKRLFIVKRDVVINSPIEEKKCKNRGWQLEPFYVIPITADHSKFYFKKNNKWTPYEFPKEN